MKNNVSLTSIQNAIKVECEFQELPVNLVMGKSRQKMFIDVRQRIHYALIDLFILIPQKMGIDSMISYENLGDLLGKDHATLIHTRKTLEAHYSLYKEEEKKYFATRSRMARVLGIDITNADKSIFEEVRVLYYHFRQAEKNYDVEKQAKYRKLLDEKLYFNAIASEFELAGRES